jgi:hypothetical protein
LKQKKTDKRISTIKIVTKIKIIATTTTATIIIFHIPLSHQLNEGTESAK